MKNRIRELRDARGWSMAKLGSACNPPTTRQQIEKLETKDPRSLKMDWVVRLAGALEVSEDELLGRRGPSGQNEAEGDLEGAPHDVLEERVARVLYLDGEAATMRVSQPALLLSGIAPGSTILVDLNREPKNGDLVVASVFHDEREDAETILRVFRTPDLVPNAIGHAFRTYSIDDPRVFVRGVIVACYQRMESVTELPIPTLATGRQAAKTA